MAAGRESSEDAKRSRVMIDMKLPLMVGIAGGTGSGKSTLAKILLERLPDTTLMDLDSYYLDRSGISPEERRGLNYDEPLAFDFPLILDHVRRLAAEGKEPRAKRIAQRAKRLVL